MLYPKEQRESKTLNLSCRSCNFEKPAVTNRVYTNHIAAVESGNIFDVNTAVVDDVALFRSKKDKPCPKCSSVDLVYFQPSADRMTLLYVCTNQACRHQWRE
jgi:DNA-directed RNA polymerase subunit M/transcription elongation factor TFIIS